MSIWTTCQGGRHIVARTFDAWRVVEGQHIVATRPLVDSLEEQEILEDLIDEVKPPPPGPELEHLHFLLYTPFRYPPLRHGSRFGSRLERSLFYGSLERETALAERAYYKFLFVEGTSAPILPLQVDETAFRAEVEAKRFVDLCVKPFDAHRAKISSPISYADSQVLGKAMRQAGVQGFGFVSARATGRAVNVGLFDPVFRSLRPHGLETWTCRVTDGAVEFRHIVEGTRVFPRGQFEVGGTLPHPGN